VQPLKGTLRGRLGLRFIGDGYQQKALFLQYAAGFDASDRVQDHLPELRARHLESK
jgi:hypothetical protein